MQNKRFLVAMVFVIALSLIFSGCSVNAELVGNMIAPWEAAAETPKPDVTTEPEETPLSLPSPEATEAPATAATPIPLSGGDIEKLMFFDANDVSAVINYWPLKTYTLEDLGKLTTVFISYGDNFLYMSYDIESTKDYEELKSELMPYISGSWDESEYSASVSDGRAEGIQTDCSISPDGLASFTFRMDGSYEGFDGLLDKHWPEGAIAMPPQMEGNLSARCVQLSSIMIYLSYEWELPEYKDAFQWFRDNMSAMDGYKYSPASSTDDEMIRFKIGNVDVEIRISEEFGTLTVTYISSPENFTL